MTPTVDNSTTTKPLAALTRYMREEAARRVDEIEQTYAKESAAMLSRTEQEKQEMMVEGRNDFPELEQNIRATVVGQAKWEAEAMHARALGNAIEQALQLCEQRLRSFAGSKEFPPVLETLLLEAAVHARGMLTASNHEPQKLGILLVAPDDKAACVKAVQRHALELEVRGDDSVGGGVILLLEGTSHRIINTLESRMARMQPRLRELVTRRLAEALNGKADHE